MPFLLVHVLIGHKEIRFLFPLLAFVPVFIIEALSYVQQKYPLWFSTKWYRVLAKIFLVVNFIAVIIIVFKPAENNIALFKAIYEQYEGKTEIYSFENNPYIDGEIDEVSGDIFHDHFRIYDEKNVNVPLVQQSYILNDGINILNIYPPLTVHIRDAHATCPTSFMFKWLDTYWKKKITCGLFSIIY